MKLKAFLTNAISNSHRLICFLALVLASFLLLYSASIVQAIGNYAIGSWGTTNDTQGLNMGPVSDRTCFLSGIAGNLNLGAQPGFACGTKGEPSTAKLAFSEFEPKHYRLVAHGAACKNQVDQKVWSNNPVNAQATCFFNTDGKTDGLWRSDDGKPVKVAPLPSGYLCFLTGVNGVGGAWNSADRFARVRKVTTTDSSHPTTGWYIEANLPTASDGSHASVTAGCVKFRVVRKIITGSMSTSVTKTQALTSGPGKKACALTGIKGAFKTNSWTDGIIMNPPANIDGNWSVTVTGGKSARWTCVE